ncbi:DNA repair protein rev1 [Plakobranchus ocellatus]|uniref:DNA repair protein rev1 n=1 Tax=Plakobranchus ocellatus TaxID=259542 RepID=A0AAV4DES0_9GAST|nr:DNA repair protein rev1 [Plakobranchus ocellatus]
MLIGCTYILTDTGGTAMEFARLLRTDMRNAAQQGDPRRSGFLSDQGTSGGARTHDRRVSADDEDEEAKEGYDLFVPKGSTGVETFHSMSEIASCSYEARKAGVKNGMFMGRALQLCPDLQTITYNFSEYNRISKVLYDLVASYTHDSCDEMLIGCTDILTDTGGTAMEFARLLRTDMRYA